MMPMMSSDFDVESLPEPYRTNVRVWRHTQSVCKRLPPPKVPTTKVRYDANFACSKRTCVHTRIQVVPMDTLKAAEELMKTVPETAVLNMADDCFPTGCVDTGSVAQEESLCRSSTLSNHIDLRFYPLKDGELLYSPCVLVFKDCAENDFRPLERPYEIDVISCPGLRHPLLTSDSNLLREEDRERLRVKIRTIFQAALNHGRKGLVLGALGCGAWRSPPEEVATVFRSVIMDEFDGAFEAITFAVMPQARMQQQLFAPQAITFAVMPQARMQQQLFAPHLGSRSGSSRTCNFQIFSSVLNTHPTPRFSQ
jgi:uncharacterized protein (TIGR02452 family)